MEAPDVRAENAPPELRPQKHRATIVLLCFAVLLSSGNFTLVPASFKALETAIGLAPSDLAMLVMAESLAMSLSMPLWSILLRSGVRATTMVVVSSAVWGALTALAAGVQQYRPMLLFRLLTGAAQGMLVPSAQTIIGASVASGERGFYFGMYKFGQQAGGAGFGVYTSTISQMQFDLGAGVQVEGWRVAFMTCGLLSFALSAAFAVFAKDPPSLAIMYRRGSAEEKWSTQVAEEFRLLGMCCRMGTFKLLVVQCVFGGMISQSLSFGTMYFQYCRFTDFQAGLVGSVGAAGDAFGRVIGGWLADELTTWSRFHGRTLVAQVSMLMGIPLLCLTFSLYPIGFHQLAAICIVGGLVGDWGETAMIRPMLTEIVAPKYRPTALSWFILTSQSLASMGGAPMVGVLAERFFGYRPTKLLVQEMPEELRESNRQALSFGILACVMFCASFCFLFLSLIHFTYPYDVCNEEEDKGGGDGERQRLVTSS